VAEQVPDVVDAIKDHGGTLLWAGDADQQHSTLMDKANAKLRGPNTCMATNTTTGESTCYNQPGSFLWLL
jgi:hypothetical protein